VRIPDAGPGVGAVIGNPGKRRPDVIKKKAPAKKLTVKKETVKDVAVRPAKGRALGDDDLDKVAGGRALNPGQSGLPCQVYQPPKFSTRPACVAPTSPPTECK
jgi:hypothetical protein